MTRVLIILWFVLGTGSAHAQMLSDTLFTWQGYARESTCRVRIYRSGPDAKRPMTVVLGEIAENRGRSTLDDARLLVELVSRTSGLDPELVYWIFHWGSFSHAGAEESGKEMFLRATFRKSDSGTVGSPSWRLVNRQTVEDYTDRAFR